MANADWLMRELVPQEATRICWWTVGSELILAQVLNNTFGSAGVHCHPGSPARALQLLWETPSHAVIPSLRWSLFLSHFSNVG